MPFDAPHPPILYWHGRPTTARDCWSRSWKPGRPSETTVTAISLRPADPDRDFAQLAAWFTILEDDTNTETSLREYYATEQGRITHQVAEAGPGELLGFYWATRDWAQPDLAACVLYVSPEQRGRGIGRRLYADLLAAMTAAQVGRLRVSINDACPEDRAFAERRGFAEHSRSIAMRLDLAGFDDRPYDAVIARLQARLRVHLNGRAGQHRRSPAPALRAQRDHQHGDHRHGCAPPGPHSRTSRAACAGPPGTGPTGKWWSSTPRRASGLP